MSHCGDIVISGVICHGVIDDDGRITLHDMKPGVAWNGHKE